MDRESLNNYCPVSNLTFISKVLQKVVKVRLVIHLLHDSLQSAYCQYHSTESALLKVHNDIVEAMDRKSATVLVMLHLSAAFDVIDHQFLFQRLEHTFGTTAQSLSWMRSYLANRHPYVKLGDTISADKLLD